MGVDREKWKPEFRTGDRLPPWTCPSCGQTTLRVAPETLKDVQTKASKEWQEQEGSEAEHIDGRFACLIECTHCQDWLAAAGTYRVEDDRYWDETNGESGDFHTYYRVKYFTDSPHLVDLPEATPDLVRAELLASFQLYWSDPVACTNRIRSSVEKLLTAQKVPQKASSRRGFMSLHDRIVRYEKSQPDIANSLKAVKWIGNAGSHSKPVKHDDAIDGYVLMDWVLHQLYAKRNREAAALARQINRRKGPRSPRRGVGRRG